MCCFLKAFLQNATFPKEWCTITFRSPFVWTVLLGYFSLPSQIPSGIWRVQNLPKSHTFRHWHPLPCPCNTKNSDGEVVKDNSLRHCVLHLLEHTEEAEPRIFTFNTILNNSCFRDSRGYEIFIWVAYWFSSINLLSVLLPTTNISRFRFVVSQNLLTLTIKNLKIQIGLHHKVAPIRFIVKSSFVM